MWGEGCDTKGGSASSPEKRAVPIAPVTRPASNRATTTIPLSATICLAEPDIA